MMERYFAISDGQRDARPELGFQVGPRSSYATLPSMIFSVIKEEGGVIVAACAVLSPRSV